MLNRPPRFSLVVSHEVRHILDEEIPRRVGPENADDVAHEVAPLGAVKPLLIARLGEGLAGEASTEDVVIRQ